MSNKNGMKLFASLSHYFLFLVSAFAVIKDVESISWVALFLSGLLFFSIPDHEEKRATKRKALGEIDVFLGLHAVPVVYAILVLMCIARDGYSWVAVAGTAVMSMKFFSKARSHD
jgi:hypothetical protein